MAQVVAMQHSFREITCQHKMPTCARQLRPFFLISHEVLWEGGSVFAPLFERLAGVPKSDARARSHSKSFAK